VCCLLSLEFLVESKYCHIKSFRVVVRGNVNACFVIVAVNKVCYRSCASGFLAMAVVLIGGSLML